MLEFAGQGELYRQLIKKGCFSPRKSASYVYQMADALSYLHGQHVIHHDTNAKNLLLALNGELKIADFGWSVHAPGDRRKTLCRTPDYLLPEIVLRKEHGKWVDHWALGVLMYEFSNGSPPFEDKNRQIEFKFPDGFSADAKDLILGKLLRFKPHERLPLAKVRIHPWG
ncbi:kinase-like domain-containing protein [Lentinula aff. lateritia]|uniref:Kinase-like domain-containing protein n=1 Tax=Lentinula aff. lateritia TaxID=2804960 RepID=A0ACC1TV58_9AGAR|nr:kinase-like domain-containing protein [Lentinula aff. lateritia]